MVLWDHPSPQLKQHLNRFSCFCMVHYCDRQTDRLADHATRSVTIGRIYTVGHKKEANSFLPVTASKSMDFNAVFNDRFKNKLHPPHLINVATVPCEIQNTKNVILQWEFTKGNCIKCITASSKWIRVIMCLKFTHLRLYSNACMK